MYTSYRALINSKDVFAKKCGLIHKEMFKYVRIQPLYLRTIK